MCTTHRTFLDQLRVCHVPHEPRVRARVLALEAAVLGCGSMWEAGCYMSCGFKVFAFARCSLIWLIAVVTLCCFLMISLFLCGPAPLWVWAHSRVCVSVSDAVCRVCTARGAEGAGRRGRRAPAKVDSETAKK